MNSLQHAGSFVLMPWSSVTDSCTKYERFAEQARWLFVDGDDDRSNNEGSEE
jgi:hypothetical protein